MREIKTQFLFTIALDVSGDTPYGGRRIARFGTGTFEGPKLKGTVLPGGGGWMLIRRDDVLEVDVRIVLETDDKQLIYMSWKGFSAWPKGGNRSSQSRRSGGPGRLFLPHHAAPPPPPPPPPGSREADRRTFDVFEVL